MIFDFYTYFVEQDTYPINRIECSCRKQAEHELMELRKQFERMQMMAEQQRTNPFSEYDESINKQRYLNETLETQAIYF